jgi:hypothetical protein
MSMNGADKYYKDPRKTMLAPHRADCIGPPNSSPQPTQMKAQPLNPHGSSDVYYADRRVQDAKPVASQAVTRQGTMASVQVKDKSEVPAAADQIKSLLAAGESVVVVEFPEREIAKRLRVALELAVTREEITEERYHDVRFSYTPPPDAKPVELPSQVVEAVQAPAPAGLADAVHAAVRAKLDYAVSVEEPAAPIEPEAPAEAESPENGFVDLPPAGGPDDDF